MPKEIPAAPDALDNLPLTFTKQPLASSQAALAGVLAEQMKLADEEHDYENMERFAVTDAVGRHLFDALIHVEDDGYVFARGSSDWVATFAQGGADGHDAALCAALEEAFDRYKRQR